MSLEIFSGFDAQEGMSEASLEQLKEKMRAAAAQIAAIRKEEGKQKKQESELLKILLAFVKNSHKSDLILMISRVLEKNVPANFILAIVVLGNPEIQAALKDNFPLLAAPENPEAQQQALVFFSEDQSLPLKVRIRLDSWMKNLMSQAQDNPQKLLKNAFHYEEVELPKEHEFADQKYETQKSIHTALINLTAFVMSDFLEQNSLSEPYEKLRNFSQFILEGILKKTAESLDNRQMLGGGNHLTSGH